LTTRAPAPTPSARRSAAAGLLSLLIPGAGHAIVGRRVAAVVFLLPVALLVVAALGYYVGGGEYKVLAFIVTPGVLPALAILNIALALWRIAASVDAARRTSRRGLVAVLLGPAVLLLVIAPHVWLGSTIAATNDFLDSMFASADEPEPTEGPWITPPPDWTPYPYDETFPPEPSGPPESLGPDATKAPRPPADGGLGTLPPLGVRVPWEPPGAEPWGNDGRFDLLLMGSDAGPNRWSRRIDVMLLVEIDVATGKVAMIGVPRNVQNVPLPKGPARNAVACGCFQPLLNALYVDATFVHPDRWPGTGSIKGIGAVRSTLSELTARPVDAVLVVDLWGVIKVVDAMGGIDIDVPYSVYDKAYPDPFYGRTELYIPAGKQHLDGRMALAYARSRHQDSDYGRMARQQTLLLAIRDDIGPKTILNAPDLFRAAKGFAWTDLPRESLPNLVNLFGKASSASVKSLRIVPPKYPAWFTPSIVTKIQKNIAELLGLPWPPPSPAPSPSPAPAATIAPSAPSATGSSPPASPAPT
jgi:polyisoprenyl-teichoic acid--peptidoglycan teichoic acid transferase